MGDLSEQLIEFCVAQLDEFTDRYAPGAALPRVLGGHPVGPDVRADLAFTLSHLHRAGVTKVAGLTPAEAASRALRPIDGPATDTFYSYRVAEAIEAFGGFAGALTDGWSTREVDNLRTACDSTHVADLIRDNRYPANYRAVLARCEDARRRLGLIDDDDPLLAEFVSATVELLEANPKGFLDDGYGLGRYDIYAADIYLFTEPLAGRLGDVWSRGLATIFDMTASAMAPNGAAITWGRSIGALSLCLTVELGALAVRRDVDVPLWMARADQARRSFRGWMKNGLITAHQYRSPMSYRGPQRRAQMTLDCLGKLAWAAGELQKAATDEAAVTAAVDPFAEPVDDWVSFESDGSAGLWCYRDTRCAFVLPVVGGTDSDYLAAPRLPGRFEVPVDVDLPSFVPVAWRSGHRFVPGDRPDSTAHSPGRLDLVYDGLRSTTSAQHTLDADVERTIRVDGRTLVGDEVLDFGADLPDAMSLHVPETAHRPLHVEFTADQPHRTATVDTAGITEHRSFWGELTAIHELDVDPAGKVRIGWRVTPRLRILSNAADHWYHRAIYDPLDDRVVDTQLPFDCLNDPRRAHEQFRHADFFHLHWPEHLHGTNLRAHKAFIGQLDRDGVRVIWTQHNRTPHADDPRHTEVYRLWARAAAGVIHHSNWGRAVMEELLEFNTDAVHAVIPHPHWGPLLHEGDGLGRDEAEAALGLEPTTIRIGIVGSPRETRDVQLVLDAFAACGREDLQLLVLSLADEDLPDDPRITALPYSLVPRSEYNQRLRSIDLFALPLRDGGSYLTSGVIGDAVGLGRAMLVSDHPYLAEVLGPAGITYGSTTDDLRACLEELTVGAVEEAAAASTRLRGELAPERVAELTFTLLEQVGTTKL